MARISITKEAIDPFFNDVSLLLPFDGSFDDASNNNFTVTANGDAQISNAQSKFGGSSALFDGNGDYLVLEDDADFSFNTSFENSPNIPFAIEVWIYPTLVDSNIRWVVSKDTYGTNFSWGLAFSNTKLLCYTHNINGDWQFEVDAAIQQNSWQHISVTSDGITQRLFLNGQLLGSKNAVITNGSSKITIGCASWNNPGSFFQGYIDELRITKGVARYISNFVPPDKLPLSKNGKLNIQNNGVDQFFNNVSLLLPMDTSFADFSSNNFTLTVNGGAEIRTDQTKFGGGAGYFGPNNDYLSAASSSLFGFGTGDFTIEMWIYPQGTSSFQGFFNANNYTNGILMRWHANSTFDPLYINGTVYDWQPAIYAPVNTWSHVALVRYGGTVKMFVNGVNRIGNVTNNSNIGSSAVPLIGASAHNTNEGFNGYIDDLRVTKGVARYIADFIPPNSSFSAGKTGKVNISKLIFPMKDLLAFWKLNDTSDSSGNNNNLTDNNGVVFGEPGVVGNGARTTWGNNGSYLTTDLFINGDATLSMWFRFDSLPVSNPGGYSDRYPLVFQKYPFCALGTNSNYPRKLILTDLATWGVTSANEIFTVGQWCHIVTVIENSKAKVYADGVLILETPAQYTNTFESGGRLLGFGGDNVDLATSNGTDTRYDSIGMWNRALTYNEIMTLYNNGGGLEP